MPWLKESPSYFRFRDGTIRLEESLHNKLSGEKLNLRTGAFEPATTDEIHEVLKPGADLDYSALSEEQFVKETEEARSYYLRGSGPVFDIYRQVNETFDRAERERRRISPDERSIVADLYRSTFRLWEEELARRAAGQEPTFNYSWVGDQE